MSDRVYELLTRLYDEAGARAAYEGTVNVIETYKPRIARSAKSDGDLFSQRDVILITYGDTLQHNGEAPLRTLHRFARDKLDGVVSAIHILPFFPYSSDDGFSVQDFYAVNPDLGDWPDVVDLGSDFDLMFDAVFNHMSAQSDWFRRFLAGEDGYAGMFVTESPDTDLSAVTRPRAHPLLTAFERPNGDTIHVWTTFSADQVDFNAKDPVTLVRLLDILLFYVEKGARIIRLDAIAYLWKEAGTNSIHLEQTHDVIRLMRAVLDAVAPEVIIITETNVPHAENVSYFGDGGDEAQMVYNFTLPPLLFHTVLSGDSTRLREWVNTLETPSDMTTFFNFTASHDGIGVRPVEGILNEAEVNALVAHVKARGGRVNYKRNSDGSESPYELNCTYVDALTDPAESEDMQVKRFLMSQAIQLALTGVPAIYIHSLLGSHNWLEGMAQTGHNRTINRQKLDTDAILAQLDDADSFRAKVFYGYVHLIQTRIQQSAFHPNAGQSAVDTGNPSVFALQRESDSQMVLAVYNVTGTPQNVDLSALLPDGGRDLLAGQAHSGTVELPPYAVLWLERR